MVFHPSVVYLAACCLLLLLGALLRRRPTTGAGRTIRLASISTDVPSYRSSLPRISRELDRARRYLHPLTVVVLTPDTGSLVEPHVVVPQLLAFSLVGSIMRDAFRAVDILAFDPTHDQYVLLLPESPKLQARQAVKRLQDLVWTRAGVRVQAGMAEFPTEGLTIDDLLGACRRPTHDASPAETEIPVGVTATAGGDRGGWR